MEESDDPKSIFIQHGKYRYQVLTTTVLIPKSEPELHGGQWDAKITIYKTSHGEPRKVQSFHEVAHHGATEDEARIKGHNYGMKLVLKKIEGLQI